MKTMVSTMMAAAILWGVSAAVAAGAGSQTRHPDAAGGAVGPRAADVSPWRADRGAGGNRAGGALRRPPEISRELRDPRALASRTDEHVVVVSGALYLRHGRLAEGKRGYKTLATGGFALMPANMNHFAYTARRRRSCFMAGARWNSSTSTRPTIRVRRRSPQSSMPPLRLLAVLAHPDDESLGFGGTLAKYASRGRGDVSRHRHSRRARPIPGSKPGEPEHPGPADSAGSGKRSCARGGRGAGRSRGVAARLSRRRARSRRPARGGRAHRRAHPAHPPARRRDVRTRTARTAIPITSRSASSRPPPSSRPTRSRSASRSRIRVEAVLPGVAGGDVGRLPGRPSRR